MKRRDFLAGLIALPALGFLSPALARLPTKPLFEILFVQPNAPAQEIFVKARVGIERLAEAFEFVQDLIGRVNATPFLGFEPGRVLAVQAFGNRIKQGPHAGTVSLFLKFRHDFNPSTDRGRSYHSRDFGKLGLVDPRSNEDGVPTRHAGTTDRTGPLLGAAVRR